MAVPSATGSRTKLEFWPGMTSPEVVWEAPAPEEVGRAGPGSDEDSSLGDVIPLGHTQTSDGGMAPTGSWTGLCVQISEEG